jgi:hypothetical protein
MVWDKVAVFNKTGDGWAEQPTITNRTALGEHANARRNKVNRPSRLYIIQLCRDDPGSASPRSIQRLKNTLARMVGMPPKIIDDHLDIWTRLSYSEEVLPIRLASDLRPTKHFCVEYFELRSQPQANRALESKEGARVVCCSQTKREIQCHDLRNQQMLLILSRKCSFWSTTPVKPGDPWDGKRSFLSTSHLLEGA